MGTPSAEDGSADLSAVRAVASVIAEHASENTVVIIKSTVPVGTADMVRSIVESPVVDVVSNPEFLREGVAIEFEHPDRIVVGYTQEFAGFRLRNSTVPLSSKVIRFTLWTTVRLKSPNMQPMHCWQQNLFLPTSCSIV